MLSPFAFDSWLYAGRTGLAGKDGRKNVRWIESAVGHVRVLDTGGDKPVLMMAPDGPCFIEHFAELIERAGRDWRVVVFDMPGFGQSFPRRDYRHSFAQAAQVIDQIYTSLNLQTATLAFSCANGFYALYFAKLKPYKVRQLVLIQTPAFNAMGPWAGRAIPGALKIPYLGQWLAKTQALKIPKIWFKIALPRDSASVEGFTAVSCREIEGGACNCLASVVQGLFLMRQNELSGVTVPVRLIWGARDHSHRYTDPESLLEMVPHAQIEIWEHVGHFANLEDPERFLKVCSAVEN